MLQRLGIRGKLLAVVLVPVFVLVLAATYITWTSVTSFRDASNAASMVDAIERATRATDALQAERDAGVNFVTAVQDSSNLLEQARAEADLRYQTLLDEVAREGSPRAQEVLNAVLRALEMAPGDALLADERSFGLEEAPEDGWIGFPSNDDVFQMGIGYSEKARQISEIAETGTSGTDLQQEVAALAVQVSTEGDLAKNAFTVPVGFMEKFQANTNDVDEALASLESWVGGIDATEANALPLQYFNAGLGIQDGITSIRKDIASGEAAEQTVKGYYSSSIRAFQSAAEASVVTIPDPGTAAELKAFNAVDRLIEAILYESATTEALIRRGVFISGEADFIKTIVTTTDIALANAQDAVAQVPQLTQVRDFGASEGGEEGDLWSFPQMRISIQSGSNNQLQTAQNRGWRTQVDQEVAAYAPVRAEAFDDVKDATGAAEQAAAIRVVVTGAIVLAAVIASILVALLIARRIVNPLRRLTTTATAVRQELPRLVERVALPGQAVDVSEVQIPVESMDEVGRLAEAFNSVNAATLSIAAEQAALRGSISEMFINVARRDQVLLNRQLASIDEMERTQDDPETLTKLFALDHLATRMRRNSESLLVLAGIDTGRRLRRPMPLSDVIRTASSEIELYERVQLELDEDPAMLGHSALTAAHLFAELLENATVFSDPGSPVVVRTKGIEGGCEVTIIDSGIGMTPEELAEANSRVASTAASEILGAQRLGLFVVGRIARRVGARVHLESVEGEGTVATITMPASLFDMTADSGMGHVSSTASDEAVHAPAALVHRSEDFEMGDLPMPAVVDEPLATSGAASLVMDVADDEVPGSAGVERLVARDAAAAPEAEPVDLDALTAGTTGAGLPTRRRKQKGPEAPKDTDSIIALPQRASDEQLSALTSAASSGFTPILAADEISPESAEQRARVFRGFRPIRSAEGEEPVIAPDAESLGHAVRRGALTPDEVLAAGVPADAIPTLEPEPQAAPLVAAHAEAILDAPQAPSPFAVEPADPRHPGQPVVTQDPRIAAGFDPTQTFGEGVPVAGDPFAVPSLEDDDFVEDEPRVLTPWGRAARAAAKEQQATPPTAQSGQTPGVETLSAPLRGGQESAAPAVAPQPVAPQPVVPQPVVPQPVAPQPIPAQPVAPQPVAAVAPAYEAPQRSPLYPAGAGTWQQPVAAQPVAADVVTSSPSLDQLILEGARRSEPEKAGFFGKLFGKSKKEPASRTPLQDMVPASTFPLHAAEALTPVPPASGEFAMPASGFDPAPVSGGFDTYEPPLAGQPVEQAPQAYAEAAAYAAPAGYGGPSGYAEEPSFDVAVLPGAAPAAPVAPWLGGADTGAHAAFAPAAAPSVGASEWAVAPATTPVSEHPQPLFDSSTGTFYSPDQLARPLGWEAAGASALQAAAPEVAAAYHPVVEIASEPQYNADEEDVASAVFSELSSLAAERPKVQKTRAGLVKREPVEHAPQPVAPEPTRPAPLRDPDAVRRKFVAFYSGTQRAKTDVREYNESIQGSLTER